MKHITTVMKATIKRRKGVYISVFILMLIVSVTLFSVLTYYTGSSNRIDQCMEENDAGDLFSALRTNLRLKDINTTQDKIVKDIETCEDVEKVKTTTSLNTFVYIESTNKTTDSILIISQYDPNMHLSQYDEAAKKTDYKLQKGEVAVPIAYKSLYKMNVGDEILIGTRDNHTAFKIASFLEDPFMGSSIMGIKTLVMNDEDFQRIVQEEEAIEAKAKDSNDEIVKDRIFYKCTLLNIYQKSDSELNMVQFEKQINEKSGMAGYCWITLSRTQSKKYMTTMSSIYVAILIIFVLVLLIATIVVLGHNIGSNIEMDYTNIGILKAVGMTNNAIRMSLILGYLGVIVAAILVAVPCAIPITRLISNITRNSSGLYLDNSLDFKIVLIVSAAMLLLVGVFIVLKTIRVAKVTPLKAINGGINNIHFSSVLKLPISKRFLNISLAYRQVISEKKQYISAVLVTAVLTLCMIMVNDVCRWANDKKTVLQMFSITSCDMKGNYGSDEIEADAEKIINKYTSFTKNRIMTNYVLFDDMQIQCYAFTNPDFFKPLLKGKICINDDELMITEYMADSYDLNIGDEVTVKKDGIAKNFIITGIYDGANDQGKNFAMLYDGYSHFIREEDKKTQWGTVEYRLKDDSVIDNIKADMRELYEENSQFKLIGAYEDDGIGIDSITLAISAITILIYILGAVFILVTVFIVCSKFIRREKKDYGIYKSVGVYSRNIRRQLAIRFAISAFFGAILGAVLNLAISGYVFRAVFSTLGICNFESVTNFVTVIIPIAFMTAMFGLFAYIKSRKVKRTDVRILISE